MKKGEIIQDKRPMRGSGHNNPQFWSYVKKLVSGFGVPESFAIQQMRKYRNKSIRVESLFNINIARPISDRECYVMAVEHFQRSASK